MPYSFNILDWLCKDGNFVLCCHVLEQKHIIVASVNSNFNNVNFSLENKCLFLLDIFCVVLEICKIFLDQFSNFKIFIRFDAVDAEKIFLRFYINWNFLNAKCEKPEKCNYLCRFKLCIWIKKQCVINASNIASSCFITKNFVI